MKALIVDVDAPVSRLAAELLAKHGFESAREGDPRAALGVIAKEPIELVIVARHVDGHDGLEFCRQARQCSFYENLVVLVTASGISLVDPMEVLDAGASDVIQRPLDPVVFETRIVVAKRHCEAMRRRREATAALHHSMQTFRVMVESAPTGLLLVDPDGRIVLASNHAAELFGYTSEEMAGLSVEELVPERYRKNHPAQRMRFIANPSRRLMGEGRDLRGLRRDGTEFPVELGLSPLRTPAGLQVVVNVADITQRKRLEEQFIQSQKMESLGRLAGGLAHDFNNLLAVILTNCGFLLRRTTDALPWRRDLEGIRDAAERAAELTRQLLAISRKQVMSPKLLDINSLLAGLEEMLRRLIGEDVELSLITEGGLGSVQADPNQFIQVVVNLVVNARDSMPQGGRLTIETANVDLDEEYCRLHTGVEPGAYVRITVSDTGSGMDEEIKNRIFEPFFTTKEVGKGTGLGLSTALGIVKQSGGHMWVYSEPGHGSSFKIFLPRAQGEARPAPAAAPAAELRRGSATILLVEDAELVRDSARKILESCGYRVEMASSGPAAIEMVEGGLGHFDLLLTDVVMPRMSGKELANELARRRPGLKVLFMSGYTDSNVAHQEMLGPGMAFLQKPFTIDSLSRKVAEVLEAPVAPVKASPTVLVIDDKEDLRRAVCFYLEDAGYRTIEASSSEEGRRHLSRGTCQLVVTDLRLSDGGRDNGYQAIVREFPEVPVIVMSGSLPEDDEVTGPEGRKPAASLLKPFEKEELLSCVREALDGSPA